MLLEGCPSCHVVEGYPLGNPRSVVCRKGRDVRCVLGNWGLLNAKDSQTQNLSSTSRRGQLPGSTIGIDAVCGPGLVTGGTIGNVDTSIRKDHHSGPQLLAPAAARAKPRRGLNDDGKGCLLCPPRLAGQPGSTTLGIGQARMHPNLWPLAPVHLIVVPEPVHCIDPLALVAQGWGLLLDATLAACALAERTLQYLDGAHTHVVAGASLGPDSGASLDHLHTQVLGGIEVPAYLEEQQQCPVCESGLDVATFGDGGDTAHVSVPTNGLCGEVLIANRQHAAEWSAQTLENISRALRWCHKRFADLGYRGSNLVLHRDQHWHLHLRPAPPKISGLEDALGAVVVRWQGQALVQRLLTDLP